MAQVYCPVLDRLHVSMLLVFIHLQASLDRESNKKTGLSAEQIIASSRRWATPRFLAP
jgi:hypothetical protein